MGRLVKLTDGKGYITTYSYDLLGRQTKVTNPDSTSKTYAYDDTANTLTETNEKSTAMKYFYDGLGNIKAVRDVTSGVDIASFTYDAKMRLTQETTMSVSGVTSSKIAYTYDVLDRVLTKTVTNASNVVLGKDTYAYETNASHRIVTHTVEGDANAPSVKTTSYTDNMGRVAKKGYFIGAAEYTDDYTYDYVGNALSVKTAYTKQYYNSRAYTSAWEYDYANRVTREYDTYGNSNVNTYNALGQKVNVKDPKGSTSTYTYDALGRLIKQELPFEGSAVSTTKYYYDGNNNVTEQRVSSNAIGASPVWATVGYEYNNRNMMTKTTNYNLNGTAAISVQYAYDATGNVTQMTIGANITKHEYDRFNNMTKLTDPMGYVERYTYDLLGNMLTKTDRKGTIFTYTYDGLGRLLNTKNGSTTLETYTYTLTGAVRTESNSIGTLTYTYDSLGRVTSVTEPNSVTKTYTYDIGSNRLSSVIKVGTTTTNNTTYTYDEAGRMKTVLEGGALQCTYAYDVNGNRSSMIYPNGTSTEYTYNLANMVKTLTNKKGTTVLSSYSYAYQVDGNQVSKTDHTGKVTNYVYDGLGRLTSETEKTGTTVTFSLAYEYDQYNNRTKQTTNTGAVTTYVYDKNNRLTSSTEAGVASIYAYDNNGNTLTKTTSGSVTETYAYDVLNRMISSTVSGVSATYIYRPDGLRYSKASGGVTTIHIWDGVNIVGDVANGTVSATYVRGIGLIASNNLTFSASRIYYHYNGHGDVVQITSINGTVITSYDYDTFGNEKLAQQTWDNNPFRYCGEYYGLETKTYYLRNRNYNPTTGRFLTEDPVGDGLNWYTYASNNPIMFFDPSGLVVELQAAPKRSDYEFDWQYYNAMLKYTRAVNEYNRAIEYLNQSDIFKELYNKLDTAKDENGKDVVFTVVFNNNLNTQYVTNTHIIDWDPTFGGVLSNGSVISAAIILAHEMGHGAQHLDGETDAYNNASILTRKRERDKLEAANLKKYETPIAKQLGEPTRAKYKDAKPIRMNNSIHYRTTHPGKWGWFTPYTVNHNQFPNVNLYTISAPK